MSRWLKFTARLSAIIVGLAAYTCLAAGGFAATAADDSHEQSWAREQRINMKQDARTIIQQKAQARAQQRQDRMASMAWYGMSASRPTGAATPFTSRSNPMWEMPGGKPLSWYPAWARPDYVFCPYWWP
ncbi:MAG TPA: hypothetical protein VFW73_11600 [Lacipirellulaceae bacterium]|nr:hypothetical protein [Lacipirellulaceae bacterium]